MKKRGKIIQLVPSFCPSDAISGYVLLADRQLAAAGYRTEIAAAFIDRRLPRRAHPLKDVARIAEAGDLLVYHLSDPHPLTGLLPGLPGRKIVIYHNRTPASFFFGQAVARQYLSFGDLDPLRGRVDLFLGVSRYNATDLVRLGLAPVESLPPLFDGSIARTEPDAGLLKTYRDGWVNLLFVGRIAPNKRQDDLLRLLAVYQKYYEPKSRLLLVGKVFEDMEPYYRRLLKLERDGRLSQVVFAGAAGRRELAAYYRAAHLYVSLSEHEGLGLPLLEAMACDLPVLAYDAAAVAETLGGSGVLVRTKGFDRLAGLVECLVKDEDRRREMIAGQRRRLAEISPEAWTEKFLALAGEP